MRVRKHLVRFRRCGVTSVFCGYTQTPVSLWECASTPPPLFLGAFGRLSVVGLRKHLFLVGALEVWLYWVFAKTNFGPQPQLCITGSGPQPQLCITGSGPQPQLCITGSGQVLCFLRHGGESRCRRFLVLGISFCNKINVFMLEAALSYRVNTARASCT